MFRQERRDRRFGVTKGFFRPGKRSGHETHGARIKLWLRKHYPRIRYLSSVVSKNFRFQGGCYLARLGESNFHRAKEGDSLCRFRSFAFPTFTQTRPLYFAQRPPGRFKFLIPRDYITIMTMGSRRCYPVLTYYYHPGRNNR